MASEGPPPAPAGQLPALDAAPLAPSAQPETTRAPAKLSTNADWKLEDFFLLSAQDETTLKLRLAAHLQLRYGTLNPDKPFALPVAGVPPYNPDTMKAMVEAYTAYATGFKGDGDKEPPSMTSTVVNGCMVQWNGSGAQNTGYILQGCKAYLANWDTSIERRAVGLDVDSDFCKPRLTCTNTSSLRCLFAHVVHAFKTTATVPGSLQHRALKFRGACCHQQVSKLDIERCHAAHSARTGARGARGALHVHPP